MTGRELIVYILENNLENEDILNPNEKLNTHIFIREDVAAAECNVGIASIKANKIIILRYKIIKVLSKTQFSIFTTNKS